MEACLLDRRNPSKSREQSENVYENKGQRQYVAGSIPVLDFPARRGNGQRRLPKTRRDERPQRRAKRAHLRATSLEKSTNDPRMSMKTKDKYNLSVRQKVVTNQTPVILSAAKDLRSSACAGHLGELRRSFAAMKIVVRASRPLWRGHPARAGAGRSRDRGRDARAASVRRRAIFMVSGCPSADGHERLP